MAVTKPLHHVGLGLYIYPYRVGITMILLFSTIFLRKKKVEKSNSSLIYSQIKFYKKN